MGNIKFQQMVTTRQVWNPKSLWGFHQLNVQTEREVSDKNGDAKKHQLLNHDLGLKPIVTWGLGDPKNDLRTHHFWVSLKIGYLEIDVKKQHFPKETAAGYHIFRDPLVNVNKQLWKIAMLLIGKSTISLGHFPVRKLLNYQRVYSGHFTWDLFSAEAFAAWNCAEGWLEEKTLFSGRPMATSICRQFPQNPGMYL